MWRVLGTFAAALQCVLCTLLANIPSFSHSLVSIHSAPWFSQCYFDRRLGGRLWLGSHGNLLAAKEIAALLTAPTLQYFNWVRIFKGICHLSLSALLRKTKHVKKIFKLNVETSKNLFCIL